MGYTCCVPNCRTGYKPRKNEEPGPKLRLFVIPKDHNLRQKWLKSIPRYHWTVSKNHRVCEKHFSPEDFTQMTHDTNKCRRDRRNTPILLRVQLKPDAIPHIFPDAFDCLGSPRCKTVHTSCSANDRVKKENSDSEVQVDHSSQLEEVETLSSLKDKIRDEILPPGYIVKSDDDSLQFHFLDIDENTVNPPKLAILVSITNNLELSAFVDSKPVPRATYEDVLPSGVVQSTNQVADILDLCMTLYTSGDDVDGDNLALFLLENC